MSKIFVCISGKNLKECQVQSAGKQCAELRMDLVNLSFSDIKSLWPNCEEWILTLRKEFTKRADWKSVFQSCLGLNPLYVDLDSELPEDIRTEVSSWVNGSSSELMLSYHNFKETPSSEELTKKVTELKNKGAAVVKIACMANVEEDNLKMIDLYSEHKRLVAFCMGEEGRESRVTALFFGEKMTYAAPSAEEIVAPGQLTYAELSDLLNLGFDDE